MRVLSLYCGAGGMDEGLKQVGIKTTLAIDCEKDCIETMKLNHGCETIIGKVTDYLESFSDFDVIVGGPPCPEFSRAKADRSFDTTEINNFWSIVDKCKPKYHMMENVQDIIQVLKRQNFLVNCADYGVPQTRVRRFYTNLLLPKQTHSKTPSSDLFGNPIQKWVSVKEALGLDGRIYISSYGYSTQNRENITRNIDEPADTVVVANEMRITNYKIKSLKKIRNRNPTYYKKHPANDIVSPCSTILNKDRGTEGYIHDNEYTRKLTNEELATLQGFPKSYRFYGNKTSVRRQIGNAVPPQVIQAFFKQVPLPLIREVTKE